MYLGHITTLSACCGSNYTFVKKISINAQQQHGSFFTRAGRCRMQCPLCNTIRRTLLHMQYCPRYCICNIVRGRFMQSCPPERCCIMQLCPPRHICICSCVRPVQNRPCSKRPWLTEHVRHFFYKLRACHEWPGFCIAPDTIAYAKVSGADSIADRTQLHLTSVTQVAAASRRSAASSVSYSYSLFIFTSRQYEQ